MVPQEAPYPPARWRLVVGGAADGATNMAIDEAILTTMREAKSRPTLRFYAWSPPCLSLGRNQRLADVDREACLRAGVDIVRRPTGGRGILHTDELTYAIALPQEDPRATGDVVESYRRLSQGLLAGLRMLGADVVQAVGQSQAGELTAVCFDTPSNYEITVDGRKLVGSAQWRAKGGVLQHGSLPLQGDITRILGYLDQPAARRAAQRETLAGQAVTLEGALGRIVPFKQVADALAQGFAQALNLSWEEEDLTARERRLAIDLRATLYANPGWTKRR